MSERSLNKVELIGRLGNDCELKYTPTGKARTTFSVATSRRWKPKDADDWKQETEWSRCVLWESESVSKYLLKGTHVFISGELRTRKYQQDGSDRYITEILVSDVILLGKRNANGDVESEPVRRPRVADTPAANGAPVDELNGMGITDDDVPF